MNAMGIVDRNYLIKLDNEKQADEVFDVLHSLGEPIRTTTFIYNPNWCYVGFYNNSDNWTISNGGDNFGSNVISFKTFMKTFSSKDSKTKADVEDYSGKTIRALVNNPQSTGVQIGEEIKILKAYNTSSYVLDKNAKGTSGMCINRPLNLREWILVGESSTEVDIKAIQKECKKRFPIGCTYQDPGDKVARLLKEDYSTYDIYGDKHIYAHEGGGCLYKNGEYATLVSLPEEKPFKSRFKVGDWVMWDAKYSKNGPYELKSIDRDGFRDQNDNYRATEDTNYRFATSSEISEESSKKTIPEYVEYISSVLTHAKTGRIYPVISETHCKCENDKEYWWDTCEFKPSTKEAYDAQFISTTFVLPERWCVKITSDNQKVLDDWRKRQIDCSKKTLDFRGWLLSDKYDGSYTHWGVTVPTSYKEITYDQFLSYVHNPVLYDGCSKGIESLIEKERDAVYAYVGDPLPTVKTKPLIEDVQSVSVKLSTKRKINNKFKI